MRYRFGGLIFGEAYTLRGLFSEFYGMFTLYRIAFAPPRKSNWIGLLFIHKNRFYGAISLTEKSCAAPISKVERHLSERFCATLKCNVDT